MSQQQHRPAGRPRRPLLDQEKITAAAMRIVTAHGAEALTMSRLAAALDVTASALYNHAASKQTIEQWIEERLMSWVDVSGLEDTDWRSGLRRWAHSYYRVMREHNAFVERVAKTPIAGTTTTLRMYETVAAALLAGGWPPAAVIPLIVAVESFVYGSAYDAQAPHDLLEPGDDPSAAPAFRMAFDAHRGAVTGDDPAATVFDAGLEALIVGLAQRHGVVLPQTGAGDVSGAAATPAGSASC